MAHFERPEFDKHTRSWALRVLLEDEPPSWLYALWMRLRGWKLIP